MAAAPYAALIGHKLRPLLSDSQSALADCEEDVIQICHLLSRNGKLSLVRLTKSFPTIPNLRGIANANQNDERFKMWSVMLLCTIPCSHPLLDLPRRLCCWHSLERRKCPLYAHEIRLSYARSRCPRRPRRLPLLGFRWGI